MSTDRLGRVREAVKRHLDAGALPGTVTLVARNGRIAHFEAHGLIDVEAKKPMPKDGVFRLASMSKPITAVAVMMLIEEGKVRLTDPVSRFIPEFKSAKVAIAKPAATSSSGAAPAAPAAGSGSLRLPARAADAAVVVAWRSSGGTGSHQRQSRHHRSRPVDAHLRADDEWRSGQRRVARRAQRPRAEKATRWPRTFRVSVPFHSTTSRARSGDTAVLPVSTSSARIVEIASGQPFDQFLQQRLFDPLGMKDTGFPLTGPKASARGSDV